jgi:hypothetical protein
MYAQGWLTVDGYLVHRILNTAPHRMVKDENAIGSGNFLQKCLTFRIVDVLDAVLVVEVVHRGGKIDNCEALLVEGEQAGSWTNVADLNSTRLIEKSGPRHAGGRIICVGSRPAA